MSVDSKKAMSLTVEHRSKLLEMLKVLLPAKYNCSLTKGEREYERNHVVLYVSDNEVHTIHWFEFCLTELCERILNSTPTKSNRALQNNIKDFYWNMNLYWSGQRNSNAIHPIDYLYEKFIQL